MTIKRRKFVGLTGLAVTSGIVTSFASCSNNDQKDTETASTALQPLKGEAVPISLSEREERIAKAQRLLAENNMEALILDAGTSMHYFTGVRWGRSERTLAAIIPAEGEVKYICPGFEEGRLRELITIGKDVYVWQEDESPYKLIATVLKDAGILSGNIAMEEQTRFFIANGIQKEAPHFNYVSGDPVTIPCRIIKSPAEIRLMQRASNITLTAIQHGISQLQEGMSQQDLSSIIASAQHQLGGAGASGLCLFGESSAFPHGSTKPKALKKGDIVLMDCGCNVEGYKSDITRTVVFGEPSERQLNVWNLEKEAQSAGFAAAQIGVPCEEVDAASRKVITDAGFGPGYKLPGLPHRTGHGIGMDGHEWGNMVKGNTKLLEPGMCFSIEPNISIIGEFGVRLEDCVYMTEDGPKWFSQPSKSISEPIIL